MGKIQLPAMNTETCALTQNDGETVLNLYKVGESSSKTLPRELHVITWELP